MIEPFAAVLSLYVARLALHREAGGLFFLSLAGTGKKSLSLGLLND
jgi:hypothetical protein